MSEIVEARQTNEGSNAMLMDKGQQETVMSFDADPVDPELQPDAHGALGIAGGAFALISTIIGGGIVGLPFAFQTMGFWIASFILLGALVQELNSTWLYLSTKDLIPGKPESLYEIGYMLFKRSSIFFISAIIAINGFGLCMVYYITFSDIVESIFEDILGDTCEDNWFNQALCHRTTWILVLAVVLVPICLKKELQELHIVSTALFIAISVFMLILVIQVCAFGNDKFSENPITHELTPIDWSQFQKPSDQADFNTIIKAVCCMIVAFGFTQNLFPLFVSLKYKTNEFCQKTCTIALSTTWLIYFSLSIVCSFLFGQQIMVQGTNVIKNINEEYLLDPNRWEAYLLRILFMIVLGCHIPFIFFSGKEALLIIVDELDRRSISDTLDERMKDLQEQEKIEQYRASQMASGVAKQFGSEMSKTGAGSNRPTASGDIPSNRKASHLSNIRASMQPGGSMIPRPGQSGVSRGTGVGQSTFKVTIMRTTQTIRRMAPSEKRGSHINPSVKHSAADEEGTKPQENDGGLAYKDMKDFYYYLFTMIFYVVIVIGSIFIPGVDEIFELVGVICVNALAFLFPAVFYLKASKDAFSQQRTETINKHFNPSDGMPTKKNTCLEICAWVQLVLGICAFSAGMYNKVNQIFFSE